MSRKYVGAIDQGTTSTRFIIFNKNGKIISSHQIEHTQIYPQPGWVEHNPVEIWQNACKAIKFAMDKAKIKPEELIAIGVTNQRETTVVWNKLTGIPYCNAIVWQDVRTSEICKRLSENGGQNRFQRVTGLPLATYFSGPKIKWILENYPDVKKDAEKGIVAFGTIDSWLIWNLTGGKIHATDVTNASRTMLLNISTLEWDDGMLLEMGVYREMLPAIYSSSEVIGYTDPEGPFGTELPIAGVLGDQQAALFGQTCFEAGEAKNTYGTGCFLLMNTGNKLVFSENGLLTTAGYKIAKEPPVYALEGSIAITGALVQWLRDNLGIIKTSSEINSLAESVKDNGGVYFVPAFSGLFAPYWRSDARGVITGLTRFVNKCHIARAVLEATAYQTREVFEAMEKDSKIKLSALKVDGGMTASSLLMQFQADILGVLVLLPVVTETTALGAAYAAGLATGFWKNKEELKAHWKVSKEWKPEMKEEERERLFHFWKKAVEKSFGWLE
ncbi:MAG: glycerol kinase GlpK [Brevinematia bacterium]